MALHFYALAIVMGAVMSIYIPMISQSARIMGAAVMGNVPFFFVAFVTSVVIAVVSGQRGESFRKIADVPPWLFLAGVMSAGIILGATFLVPRIGTGALFVLLVTGQILAVEMLHSVLPKVRLGLTRSDFLPTFLALATSHGCQIVNNTFR